MVVTKALTRSLFVDVLVLFTLYTLFRIILSFGFVGSIWARGIEVLAFKIDGHSVVSGSICFLPKAIVNKNLVCCF